MRATVHNIRAERMLPGDVRIDRQTEHGNAFIIGRDGSREDVIAKHEAAVEARIARDPVYREKVKGLHGRRLFCWCHPEACHGDTLACIAERLNADAPDAPAAS